MYRIWFFFLVTGYPVHLPHIRHIPMSVDNHGRAEDGNFSI